MAQAELRCVVAEAGEVLNGLNRCKAFGECVLVMLWCPRMHCAVVFCVTSFRFRVATGSERRRFLGCFA